MGSMIHLTLGNLELDWGQGYGFQDHCCLFRRSDIKHIPYRYVSDNRSPIVETKEGYSSNLRDVLRRLSMLGYSRRKAKLAFQKVFGNDISPTAQGQCISFEELSVALSELDVTCADVARNGDDYDYDPSGLCADDVFDRDALNLSDGKPMSLAAVKRVIQSIDPYWLLVLLADNSSNLDIPVEWGFADIAENVTGRECFLSELSKDLKFLVVTEGSSDANILRKAFALLRPEIIDFFAYVDMQDGYPFTGTGNLYKFCQGLVGISIRNRVLIIYDNDAEGSARYEDTRKLRMPANMRAMKLPSHPAFTNFSAEGPAGSGVCDINGRAVAMECFLDLSWRSQSRPYIRWTSYLKGTDSYQGELADKEKYSRLFMELRRREAGYSFDKLEVVLDIIAKECAEIAWHEANPFFRHYL